MNLSNNFEKGLEWQKNFRELQPVKLWGADINIEGGIENFKNSVLNIAERSGKNQFGYFIYSNNEGIKYHLSRYPRRKYGAIPSDEEMEKQLTEILSNSKQKGQKETIPVQPKFRIILGLEEGYGTGKFYTTEEAVAFLGTTFNLTKTEIFTTKLQDGKYIIYQEPSVKIEGNLSEIKKVYELSERLRQERFTVDDFNKQNSYIVETRFCTSRDLE